MKNFEDKQYEESKTQRNQLIWKKKNLTIKIPIQLSIKEVLFLNKDRKAWSWSQYFSITMSCQDMRYQF